MKNTIVFFLVIILYFPLTAGNSFQDPVVLNVVAPSGLKLRATPDMNGEVLRVIPSRSAVILVDNELFPPKEDEISYIEGSWVFISYEGEEGYVFDGFLSGLPLPIHDSEMVGDDLEFVYALETWMEYNNDGLSGVDTFTSSLYSREVLHYNNGNQLIRKNTNSYYQINVILENTGLWEGYHLLVNMLTSKQSINTFTNNALFISNRSGVVDKVKIDLEEPVLLTVDKKGDLNIEIKSFTKACTLDLTKS